MATEAIVTVRMPVALKQAIAERARREHRSLSRQIVAELEAARATSTPRVPRAGFLGMFAKRAGGVGADLNAPVQIWEESLARTVRQLEQWDREDSSLTRTRSSGASRSRKG